jgi:hypothetical protein
VKPATRRGLPLEDCRNRMIVRWEDQTMLRKLLSQGPPVLDGDWWWQGILSITMPPPSARSLLDVH